MNLLPWRRGSWWPKYIIQVSPIWDPLFKSSVCPLYLYLQWFVNVRISLLFQGEASIILMRSTERSVTRSCLCRKHLYISTLVLAGARPLSWLPVAKETGQGHWWCIACLLALGSPSPGSAHSHCIPSCPTVMRTGGHGGVFFHGRRTVKHSSKYSLQFLRTVFR